MPAVRAAPVRAARLGRSPVPRGARSRVRAVDRRRREPGSRRRRGGRPVDRRWRRIGGRRRRRERSRGRRGAAEGRWRVGRVATMPRRVRRVQPEQRPRQLVAGRGERERQRRAQQHWVSRERQLRAGAPRRPGLQLRRDDLRRGRPDFDDARPRGPGSGSRSGSRLPPGRPARCSSSTSGFTRRRTSSSPSTPDGHHRIPPVSDHEPAGHLLHRADARAPGITSPRRTTARPRRSTSMAPSTPRRPRRATLATARARWPSRTTRFGTAAAGAQRVLDRRPRRGPLVQPGSLRRRDHRAARRLQLAQPAGV